MMPEYLVRYPVSGKVLRFSGQLHAGSLSGLFTVGIVPESKDDPVNIVDPRCVIESDGQVVYRPEDHYDRLTKPMRAWMDEQGRGPKERPT